MQAFLNSSAIKAALNKTGSALAALTVLKKVRCNGTAGPLYVLRSDQLHIHTIVCCWLQVCDHPALLSDNAADLVATGGTHMHSHRLDNGHAIYRMVRVPDARQMLS